MDLNFYQKIINLSAPLLITGETGTGKSVIAKKIFNQSTIHREKFLTVHLASLKDDLIESELFGYRKGAFTGAIENKKGYLKEVGMGTLFLDEIGELSLDSQKKLLYLLEEKKFTPIGSTVSEDFTGRIIMATNQNLELLVKKQSFREDLYYRISTFKLELPSITNNPILLRKAIILLFSELKSIHKKCYCRLPNELLDYLVSLEWRGNFRELRNALEYAIIMNDNGILNKGDFPGKVAILAKSEDDFLELFPENFNEVR